MRVHFYPHPLKKKNQTNIKNSSWLNCHPLQNNMKNSNPHFLVKAYFCNTYHFLQNSSILCFLPLFCRKTFPPWLYIFFFFCLVNNPENSNLAIFSGLGRNNTQSFKNQKQCQHFLNDIAAVSDQFNFSLGGFLVLGFF